MYKRLMLFQSTPPVKAATFTPLMFASASSFQSTPPVKAATDARISGSILGYISIHAAREGGDGGRKMKHCKYLISIHAAREGGDIACNLAPDETSYFNPRRP